MLMRPEYHEARKCEAEAKKNLARPRPTSMRPVTKYTVHNSSYIMQKKIWGQDARGRGHYRMRPRPTIVRPRSHNLASRPGSPRGLNIPGSSCLPDVLVICTCSRLIPSVCTKYPCVSVCTHFWVLHAWWNFHVWKFLKFREFLKYFKTPFVKFSLKFCILIIIHR